MSLVKCPECGEPVSDRAFMCPHCGAPLGRVPFAPGFEYRSPHTVWGLPLVHMAWGFDPQTGRKLIARGFIAIGDLAVGVFSIGGLAVGVFSLAGIGLGLFTFAGVSLGLLVALGGVAVGFVAGGGVALGYYAFGGAAVGVHVVAANRQDPELLDLLRSVISPFAGSPSGGGQ